MTNLTAILTLGLAAALTLSGCIGPKGGSGGAKPGPVEFAKLPPLPELPDDEVDAALGAIAAVLDLTPGQFVHVNPQLKPASFQQDPYIDLGELEDSTARDFERKLRQACLFPKNTRLPAHAEIDWTGQIASYFGQGGAGWGEYFRDHADSAGYVELSRVGFSSDGNQALIYLGHQRDWTDGSGKLLLLRRQSGGWGLVDEVVLWGS